MELPFSPLTENAKNASVTVKKKEFLTVIAIAIIRSLTVISAGDSSNDRWYHGYDLYMLVDSQSDLPVFPLFSCASKHDSHGFFTYIFQNEILSS